MSWGPRRRFWTAATTRPEAGGFTVLLDGRPLRTPAGAPLTVPTAGFAAAIATEWNGLASEILPDRLPMTRNANAAIDRVAPNPGPVVDAVAGYGASDLTCYRAEAPAGLVARQAAAWDPWLAWAAEHYRAPLRPVTGVMHQPQPAASLAALHAAVAAHGPFALTALHELVALSGSLVLGLAVSAGALEPGAAWALSRLDEAWQAEQWGIDAEAEAAAESTAASFDCAAKIIRLLRD